ncbi:hypothetical protein NP511_15980 [Natrinema thermotolerans]|uniref:Uncharacterized protein n=1 Tax=Natrinema thermotolerans TaxID=121872 RepID=A0AAF0P9H8_9EURY|nr:hypothetical protein [Natrinema thermotolerans]QCC59882.1 hypothetical protein DVR14_15090 [Natrinema thermotolerans]WMT06876.1 hypothetical protein NP511_15980 [Natrinema thermotolerans]
MACMLALSMAMAGVPAASAGGDAASNSDTVHTLEDGDELYLVFGADLGDMSLEEYVEQHADGTSSSAAEVIQHQDVDQVNINEQGSAVSVSIDGGQATAVQEANQQNDNVQTGEATAGNVEVRTAQTQFENVGEVNIIIGNGGDQQFDGWGIKDEKGDDETVTQEAIAGVTQSQTVGQVNYNNQSTAFAYAMNDSEATALQQSYQRNENLQEGMANASNVYLGDGEFGHAKDKSGDDGPGVGQSAEALVNQSQDVAQQNVNEQGGAVAIAIGENSTATAIQFTDQSNLNEQFGSATASNLMVSSLGMNVATAGDVDGDVLSTTTDAHKPDKKDKNDNVNDTEQTATAGIAQEQAVEQQNINFQNTAMALAENGSEATAIQLAYQQNYNAQVAYADALNVYASPGYVSDDVTRTSSTTVTVDGNAGMGAGTSYDYAGNATQTNDVEQEASAAIAQQQIITQQNLNEQHSSIAVAEDGGSAGSSQISMQENENVQLTSVASTNTWVGA